MRAGGRNCRSSTTCPRRSGHGAPIARGACEPMSITYWRCFRSSRRRIRRLGGPPCTYVGHPLIERLDELRPGRGRTHAPSASARFCLLLPGSRRTEISRLMQPFGEAVAQIAAARPDVELLLPAVPHLAEEIAVRVAAWKRQPRLVFGEAAEVRGVPPRACGARRLRHGDAGAGTVRRADGRRLSRRSDRAAAEALSHRSIRSCSPTSCSARTPCPSFSTRTGRRRPLRARLLGLLSDTQQRRRQIAAFERLDELMLLPDRRASERQGGGDRYRSGGAWHRKARSNARGFAPVRLSSWEREFRRRRQMRTL